MSVPNMPDDGGFLRSIADINKSQLQKTSNRSTVQSAHMFTSRLLPTFSFEIKVPYNDNH